MRNQWMVPSSETEHLEVFELHSLNHYLISCTNIWSFVYIFIYVCVCVCDKFVSVFALLKSGHVFLCECLMEAALGHLLAKISTYAYACVVCIYVF